MLRARSLEDKDARRHAMMAAALDEFFERGFTAARMSDIAKRAGLSKAALYLYFDSKEALFTALIEEYAVPNVERLEFAVAAAGSGADALRSLLGIAPTLITETNVPKIVKVLIGDSQNFPEVVQAYRRKVVDRALGVVEKCLTRAHDSGEFHITDPSLTARIVVAPIIFSAIWRVVFEKRDEPDIDLDALFKTHLDMVLHALRNDGGAP